MSSARAVTRERTNRASPKTRSATSSATKGGDSGTAGRRKAGTKSSAAVRPGASTEHVAHRPPQRRRRSADPGQRRDPARTRQLILDAASEEFGRFGYGGARVMRIAERAGVAHQLITYHFGGKRGLFDALSDQWIAVTNKMTAKDESLVEVLSKLVYQAAEMQSFGRVLVREGQQEQDHAALVERMAPMLAEARMRQDRGEIHSRLDAGIVVLVLFAANLAPVALPHVTRALSSVDPADPKFIDYYAEQLSLVMSHLGESV